MKYHLLSTKDSTTLIELMNNYTVKELGTSWNLNGSFYQSFIGELKVTPKVTKEEVLKQIKEAAPTDLPKAKTKRKPKKATK